MPPAAIGRYVVLGLMATGGQAEVFRVVDPQLGRTLVLKLSRFVVRADEAARDAILAEGRLLAEIDHSDFVRVFDVGFHLGRPYLVMEHVHGQNLEQLCESGRPTWRNATRLMAAIARTIAFAHRRGVAHGDITPRNILVDQDGRPRLIDFGLARIRDAWEERVQISGGTVGFFAPEIARGDCKRAEARCDLFSLGGTLYWLLTGAAPFAAPTVSESIDRARRCDYDRGALLAAGVPSRVRRGVMHAMAELPSDRPASAECWADELERAAASWKRPAVWIALPLAALALAAGMIWRWPTRQPNPQRQNQFIPEVAASGEPAPLPFPIASPRVTVLRGQMILGIEDALPLHDGDRISITFEVPKGLRTHLLWYDERGRLSRLLPPVEHTAATDLYAYPGLGQYAPLGPGAGTQLFLLCAGAPLFDQEGGVEASFPISVPLRRLPDRAYLKINSPRVEIAGTHDPGTEADTVEASREEVQRICTQLRRRFPAIVGFAVPQTDAAPAPEN